MVPYDNGLPATLIVVGLSLTFLMVSKRWRIMKWITIHTIFLTQTHEIYPSILLQRFQANQVFTSGPYYPNSATCLYLNFIWVPHPDIDQSPISLIQECSPARCVQTD